LQRRGSAGEITFWYTTIGAVTTARSTRATGPGGGAPSPASGAGARWP
jgi:hypothetical protein